MKIFERLFKMFVIFNQFIQIDAIVGGYESEAHRYAFNLANSNSILRYSRFTLSDIID